MAFDVQAAKEDGYTDEEIQRYLSEKNKTLPAEFLIPFAVLLIAASAPWLKKLRLLSSATDGPTFSDFGFSGLNASTIEFPFPFGPPNIYPHANRPYNITTIFFITFPLLSNIIATFKYNYKT